MTEMRSVRLYMNAVEKTAIQTKQAEIVGSLAQMRHPDTPVRDLHMAIGYLSTWNMTHPFVDIYVRDTKEPELLAVYRDELDGPMISVIVAVLDRYSGDFTFHS